jgi:hypothetical protein
MLNTSVSRFVVMTVGLSAVMAAASPKNVLTITSAPPGAAVNLNDSVVGTTSYQVKYPGGYFHGVKTVVGKRLL